jgi:hypothetical protein
LRNVVAFKVNSAQEARQFDEFLVEYQESKKASAITHISLEQVFTVIKGHPEEGRLVAYFIELQLQLALLNCDICEIADLVNQKKHFHTLLEKDSFSHRVSLLRANSDFIFRYRAIWDKIMGIFILLHVPNQYENFIDAKSRKKKFKEFAKATDLIHQSFVDHVINTTELFDERYRTNEVHGSGSARKWSSGHLRDSDGSEQLDMFGAWNALNTVLVKLGDSFGSAGAALRDTGSGGEVSAAREDSPHSQARNR